MLGTAGCAVLVISLFDTMSRLRGSDTREQVAELLADPPLRGSGVTVDDVIGALRMLGYGAGALAAAGIVLAVFVALRHRGARIGFTVVAGLLLLTMPTTGLLPVLPAVAAALLWRRDVRDWFAGREPTPAPAAGSGPGAPPGPASPYAAPPQQPPAQPPAQTPAQPPYPQPPAQHPYAPPAQQPYAQQSYAQPFPPTYDDRRPRSVTVAAVLSLVGSTLGLLAGLAVLAVAGLSPSTLEDAVTSNPQFERLDVTTNEVVAMVWAMGAVMVLWSLVAIVLAFLVLRRSSPARVLLAISAGMAALFSLIGILSGVAVVTLLLAGATLALLFSGGANDWFAGRPRSSGPGQRVSGSGPPW